MRNSARLVRGQLLSVLVVVSATVTLTLALAACSSHPANPPTTASTSGPALAPITVSAASPATAVTASTPNPLSSASATPATSEASPKARPSQAEFDAKFNQLESKMSLKKVKTLLGAPDLREVKVKTETWHYNRGEGRIVVFESGRVVEFGRDISAAQGNIAPTPVPTPVPTPIPLEIGDTCSRDSECQSKYCHLHICSGKNNCWVPEGKLCAKNEDCCTGNCDFGVCHKSR